MIRLTRRDGSNVYVSADLIETVEPTPETLVTLVDGKRLFPTESCEEVIASVMAYRAAVEALARTVLENRPRVIDPSHRDGAQAS